MRCLIKNRECKFWNSVIGCDDHTNICKCGTERKDSMLIYKYPLQLQARQRVTLPSTYRILSIQVQQGQICLWAEINPASYKVTTTFLMVGTGRTTPERALYRATVQLDGDVWHIYEEVN